MRWQIINVNYVLFEWKPPVLSHKKGLLRSGSERSYARQLRLLETGRLYARLSEEELEIEEYFETRGTSCAPRFGLNLETICFAAPAAESTLPIPAGIMRSLRRIPTKSPASPLRPTTPVRRSCHRDK